MKSIVRAGSACPITKLLTAVLALAITLTLNACEEKEKKQDGTTAAATAPPPPPPANFKTVKIGEQVWMAENLNIETAGSKCYDNKPENCQKYGRLYDWNTAKTACPSGWHLPTFEEWEVLEKTAGGKIAGKYLKAKSGWNNNKGKSGNGEDKFGFSAVPGGYSDGSSFDGVSYMGGWWSATEYGDAAAFTRNMGYDYENIDYYNRGTSKGYFESVRCIQGDAKATATAEKPAEKASGSTLTDTRDSKTYKTVKIGNQTWMAENLNFEAKGSKCYDNKPDNCKKYGRLYDWNTAKKACPSGWKLPSDAEWNTLVNFAGGETAGNALKASSWNNGNDTFGFSALAGGAGNSSGDFYHEAENEDGNWWSATEHDASDAYFRSIYYYDANVARGSNDKTALFSVRCIQN